MEDALEWKWMWGGIKVLRITGQLSAIRILIDEVPLKNVEYLIYLGSMIVNSTGLSSQSSIQ